jgi:peroxiredoxin
MAPLRYGAPAPDFSLPSTQGRPVTLAEHRGKADVVLAFYCYDFGGI